MLTFLFDICAFFRIQSNDQRHQKFMIIKASSFSDGQEGTEKLARKREPFCFQIIHVNSSVWIYYVKVISGTLLEL